MTDILINSHTRQNWQRAGSTATLRIWFTGEFRDSNGVIVDPGNGTSSFYKIVPCTVNPTTHVLTIPAFILPSTLDGAPASIECMGRLYDASAAPREFLWQGWTISNLPTTLPFDSWFIFNQGSSLSNPPDFYLNRQEVIALIDSLLSTASQGVVSGETPAGVIDGVNGTFTLARTPLVGTVALYLNGNRQIEGNLGAGEECFTISEAVITHYLPPQPGDTLIADYRTAAALLGSAAVTVEGAGALVAATTTTILSSSVTASSAIECISMSNGITGNLRVSNRVAGVSFDVESDEGADAGNFKWIIYT